MSRTILYLAASPATGASVAVWLDREVIWVGGFGSADPTGDRSPNDGTLFMIGSDTKRRPIDADDTYTRRGLAGAAGHVA